MEPLLGATLAAAFSAAGPDKGVPMRIIALVTRACPWLLATALIGLTVLWFAPTDAAAQFPTCQAGAPCFDHLKCYAVTSDHHAFKPHKLEVFNQQFGEEKCKLTDHARLICAPTAKNKVDEQVPNSPFATESLDPTQDFICYSVVCQPNMKRSIVAADQFAGRDMTIGAAKLICAPARKATP
jgi:hypothetical protein